MTADTETIRAVHTAATNLTLACTELVGAVQMEVSLSTVAVLGEPVPRAMLRQLKQLERLER